MDFDINMSWNLVPSLAHAELIRRAPYIGDRSDRSIGSQTVDRLAGHKIKSDTHKTGLSLCLGLRLGLGLLTLSRFTIYANPCAIICVVVLGWLEEYVCFSL